MLSEAKRLVRIQVIGISDEGPASLPPRLIQRIESAGLLVGGQRHLDFFPNARGRKVKIGRDPLEAIREIQAFRGEIVVLASGDPLFYGIGTTLLKYFPAEQLEFHPAPTSMQLAFSRAAVPWEEAALVSLHAKPMDRLALVAGRFDRIGIFTDPKNNPNEIARFLLSRGINDYQAVVCENLGGKEEKITRCSLEEMKTGTFGSLSVVLLLRGGEGNRVGSEQPSAAAAVSPTASFGAVPRNYNTIIKNGSGPGGPVPEGSDRAALFGLPDDAYETAGLLTKREVRSAALAHMNLRRDSVVWDIGAGSGSISIEAARLCDRGHIWAVEKDPKALEACRRNIARLAPKAWVAQKRCAPIDLIAGEAPAACEKLPAPGSVFVGGSGGNLKEILALAWKKLKTGGSLVCTFAALENLTEALSVLKALQAGPEITQIQASRSRDLAGLTGLQGMNPIWIVSARKPGLSENSA